MNNYNRSKSKAAEKGSKDWVMLEIPSNTDASEFKRTNTTGRAQS